ncbi:aspartyl-tRNA synthetase [Microdochium trichocladiopsis]|uniref:Aspartyl-tRNA synthetase n=1 Tax=Microdochium trichocladiopsis TaxID=1682393 RepID=A0A9P8YB83_9PEZI|nr:aspartyl-tRNA synthetase [Microdochium trichocladiopsis]KAH7034685.1 aspartyl-tRNA synthetase [Microdochium trichocladiopsis]
MQIVSNATPGEPFQEEAHRALRDIPAYSPVTVTGLVHAVKDKATGLKTTWDLHLRSIRPLNVFPKDIVVSKDAVWAPKQRHLQMRFDSQLFDRLLLRSEIQTTLRNSLRTCRFIEVETPVLFKSTPEGAREFLVPTRKQGLAYALPQSPQQYKQLLMAGGVPRYYQFAKCFRDEDHRADRQPEFTQLDLEVGFADADKIMHYVERLMVAAFEFIERRCQVLVEDGFRHVQIVYKDFRRSSEVQSDEERQANAAVSAVAAATSFPRYSYEHVMSRFGSDKPDLRIAEPYASEIVRIDGFLPAEFSGMITNHKAPAVEAFKFRTGRSPQANSEFIRKFMDDLPNTPLKLDSASTPGVFVIDSSRPVRGLSALGHDAASKLLELNTDSWSECEDGDIVMIHARKDEPFQGGSTDAGRLRTAIYAKLVEEGFVPRDHSYKFLWVNEFPLFTPDGDDPGQGGAAGFSATHHPFTAPATSADFDLLHTNPMAAKAAHYDLVLNGVEIGGGSRRIHIAELQEYVMRDILKMSDAGVKQFSHLIEALRAGCAPHAGFAIGFDRLMSLICDVSSVRDVIAFPKSNKGEDLLVGSPSKTTLEQQKTYHLFRKESEA